jgi:nucleoside-triphosphatase THEP1
MHILLTGPSQIGKTTIIQEIMNMAHKNNWNVGGFSTYFGKEVHPDFKKLYLEDINRPKSYDDSSMIAFFQENLPVTVYQSRFDHYAVSLLLTQQKNAQLFVLDECSFLEGDASTFQNEVLHLFQGQTMVVAVARPDRADWLQPLLNQPDVKVYHLSIKNRDAVKKEVLELIYSRMARLP